jgi:hypothetical protein
MRRPNQWTLADHGLHLEESDVRPQPLHEFAWRRQYGEAGFAQDALYLIRPDSYVALADEDGLIRSWRADSLGLCLARSRNYPMLKKSSMIHQALPMEHFRPVFVSVFLSFLAALAS